MEENKEKNINEEKIEIDFLKKYRNRILSFKVIIFILLMFIIVSFITVAIKYNYSNRIITGTYNKIQECKDLDNFKLEYSEKFINYSNNEEINSSSSFFYKEEKYKMEKHIEQKINGINVDIVNSDYSYYGEINSNKTTEINDVNKSLTNVTSNYKYMNKGEIFNIYSDINYYGSNDGKNRFLNFIGFKIRNDRYNGIDCYVVKIQSNKNSYKEMWIDKENMLVIREVEDVYGEYYREKTFVLNIGIVDEHDIEIPESEDYTIKDTTKNIDYK